MTRRINYVGPSDIRIITRDEVIEEGLDDPGVDLEWNKLNSFELDVPDILAAWLLAVDGFLADDEDLDFGDVLDEAIPSVAAEDIVNSDVMRAAYAAKSDLTAYVPNELKGLPNGVATLDSTRRIPTNQLPAFGLNRFLGLMASEAEMIALVDAVPGDWVIRTDPNPDQMYILHDDDPTIPGNWDIVTSPGAVTSVNNRTGAITGITDALSSVGFATLNGAAYISTPHVSSLIINGDIEVIVKVKMTDWTPASAQTIISKSRANTGLKAWNLSISTNGRPRFQWSADGTNDITADATVAPTVNNGEYLWLKVNLDVNNGAGGNDTKFYTSPANDGVVWTQLGTTVTKVGTTSIFTGGQPLSIGATNITSTPAGFFIGEIAKVSVANAIGGAPIITADFNTSQYNPSAEGYVWTLAGTGGSITQMSRLLSDQIGSFIPETTSGSTVKQTAAQAYAAALPRVAYNNTAGALVLGGSAYATSPPTVDLDIVGDIDVRWIGSLNDWTPAAQQTLIAKFRSSTGRKSWNLAVRPTTGLIRFGWTVDGINDTNVDSSVAPTVADGAVIGIRVTLDVDNGAGGRTVTFYTSTDMGVTWNQLGTASTAGGVTSIAVSPEPLSIGALSTTSTPSLMMVGQFLRAQVRNGINGTIVANPDFYGGFYDPDPTGKVWTLGGTGGSITAASRIHSDSLGSYTPVTMASVDAAIDDALSTYRASLPGDLTVIKAGNSLTLRSILLDDSVLDQSGTLNGSSNGSYNFGNTSLDGVVVHAPSDDIAPIRTQLGTVGANHGYTKIDQFTVVGHDKTVSDLGSRWTDGVSVYTLLAVSGSLLTFGRPYTVDGGGLTQVTAVAPASTLTHSSGATHTSSVDISTPTASPQLYPSIGRKSIACFFDGAEITDDGTYHGKVFEVRESYEVLSYKAIIDWAQAHVGQSYATNVDSIAGVVRISISYFYRAPGRMLISSSFTEVAPLSLVNEGFVQQFPMALAGHTVTRYMPYIGVMSGFNFKTGVPLAGYNLSLIVGDTNLDDPAKPPDRCIDWLLDGSSNKVLGHVFGYVVDKSDSSDASRLTNAANQYWDLRDTLKSYPRALYGLTGAVGDRWTVLAYRNYLDPTQIGVATNAAVVEDAAGVLVLLDFNQAATGYKVPLPDHVGKSITVLESDGVTLLSDIVDTEGIVVTSASYGTAILRVT